VSDSNCSLFFYHFIIIDSETSSELQSLSMLSLQGTKQSREGYRLWTVTLSFAMTLK